MFIYVFVKICLSFIFTYVISKCIDGVEDDIHVHDIYIQYNYISYVNVKLGFAWFYFI